MAPKKNKKRRETIEVFTEIDNRNRTGMGWTPQDFGIYVQSGNIAQGVGSNAITFQPGSVAANTVTGSVPNSINNPATTSPRFGNNVLPANTPASQILKPEEQARVREWVKDPSAVAVGTGPLEGAKTWLANLFDTSDTWDPTKSTATYVGGGFSEPVETVWDSLLAGLGWGYNRLTQLTVAGMSGLPGGTETLSWNEAGDVSFGQQLIANMGVSAGKVRRGEGNIFDVAAMGPLGGLAAIFDPESEIQQAGWDIANPEDRKVFEQGAEKFWSGVGDFGFTFADPLILGGKGAKLARMKWIDRPMDTVESRKILKEELELGGTTIAGGTAGTQPLSPAADFVRWATEKAPDGTKLRTGEEIFNHPMVKYAAHREQISSALYHANDYETGALIFRYAKGDEAAGIALFAKRADLADAIARQSRERMMTMVAMNPGKVKVVERYAQIAADSAAERMKSLKNAGLEGSDEWALADRYNRIAQETYMDIANGKFDPVSMATPEGVALSKKIFKDLVASDQSIAKAIGDAADDGVFRSMSGIKGLKGVPANTALGRAVERSRQNRATAAYQSAATRGALVETGKTIVRKDGSTAYQMSKTRPWKRSWWQADELGKNGFTRSVRVWRWAGEENPSGYVTIRGLGAQESFREVRAVMNDVEIYAGKARSITLENGTVVQVGGVQRKEQLLQMYMDAVNDTTGGADRAQKALNRLEDLMQNDIMSWHGIDANTAQTIKSKMNQSRSDALNSLMDPDRKFYIDEDGNFDSVPWLEQHLQNGTYMINYRELEKAARLWDEQGMGRLIDNTGQYVTQNFMRIYGAFNSVWRPSVLLRLGYTLRNVTEGQFRAAAFTSSLDPLRYGVENGIYSIGNTSRKFANRKAGAAAVNAARLRAAGNANVSMPKKYQKWLEAQIVARDTETGRLDALVRVHGNDLAEMSPLYRDTVVTHLEAAKKVIVQDIDAAKKAGASTDEIAELTVSLDDATRQIERLKNIKAFSGINDASEMAFDDLRAHIKLWENSVDLRRSLDDEHIAVAQYLAQGNAKRRIFSNPLVGADGAVYQQAFASDSPFTPLALSLASADTTQQSMLQLSMNLGNNVFKAMREKSYQRVNPGMPKYFEGYSSALRTIKLSEVGERIIAGEADDQIVDFLMSPGKGREIMDFLAQGQKWDKEFVQASVTKVRDRYDYLTRNAQVREFMRTASPNDLEDGKALESLLAGVPNDELPSVIGNIAEEFGYKGIRDTWASITSFGMKWLGTLPEDTFVRQPFYGNRFKNVFLEMLGDLKLQRGEDAVITMKDVNNLYKFSHARALKDTKDWLYTIDRRTNLGTYGEVAIPFISAAQNSTTTVGRLIWNDPTTAVILADMWRAPNRAGFEDDEGNIIVPIPHDWIPDGIEQALGLETMENWKFSKGSLNVIVPESGFAFIPRPGPLVAAPVSEFMKHGFFGMTVDSPEILRNVFGKDGADQVWNVYKNYMFGEGQGLAPDMASLSMLTPPVAQKFLQFLFKEDNAQYAYYYNLAYRTEMLNWLGGYRDEIPSKEEILNKTNGLTLARVLANVFAFTPPQYESKIDPLIQDIRRIQSKFPEDADRIIYQNYGPFLQMIGDFSNSKNYSGMGPYANSVEIAREHADLINQVSPGLERLGDLSVLSMLTMGDNTTSLYDDSAYGWQFANSIPGVNVNFREAQKPEQSWAQSRTNAGWTAYISKMDDLEARLKQSGVDSFRQNPTLKAERDQFLADMSNNPLFYEWWQDFKEFGSSRTLASVSLMESALSNEKFMAEYGRTEVWTRASEYLYHRNIVMNALAGREGGIDNSDNEDIRNYWDQARAFLKQSPEWTAFANRFLNGDDDPQSPGVQFGTYYEVPQLGEQ